MSEEIEGNKFEFLSANFTSTSKSLATAFRFTRHDAKKKGKTNYVFSIPCESGGDIAPLSAVSSEEEVLYPPSFPFRIQSAEVASKSFEGGILEFVEVKMEEVK